MQTFTHYKIVQAKSIASEATLLAANNYSYLQDCYTFAEDYEKSNIVIDATMQTQLLDIVVMHTSVYDKHNVMHPLMCFIHRITALRDSNGDLWMTKDDENKFFS